MRVMCDTNIILDVLMERQPFVEDSSQFLRLCEERRLEGFESASSVTDIYNPVRKYTHSTNLAYQAIGKLLEIVKVCSVTNNDVLAAFQIKAKDFEDCLVATCAKSIHCNAIVTQNKKDFEEFGICLFTPSEILQKSKTKKMIIRENTQTRVFSMDTTCSIPVWISNYSCKALFRNNLSIGSSANSTAPNDNRQPNNSLIVNT